MKRYVLIISIIALSINSPLIFPNEKHLYILGGGGDPAGDTTIFDTDLKNMSKFANKSDWKTTISFNGGHKNTEKIIKENSESPSALNNYRRKSITPGLQIEL